MGMNFEASIQALLAAVPGVIDQVAAELPSGFPVQVSTRIFEGMRRQSARLAEMPA
jgi:serine/threonine-protein kinase HipA